jgi:hypothetical protein
LKPCPRIVIGFHHYGTIVTAFAMSLIGALRYEGSKIGAVIEQPSPYVDEARNKIAETVLGMPFADYMLMVDADISFPEDAISRTLTVLQMTNSDVVWGNYALGNFGNSIFVRDTNTELFRPVGALEPQRIYEDIHGGGTGWLFCTRKVLETMAEANKDKAWKFFDRFETPDDEGNIIRIGEDLAFGHQANKLGFKQVGYTGLLLVHNKLKGTIPDFMEDVAKKFAAEVVPGPNPYGKPENITVPSDVPVMVEPLPETEA